MESFFLIVPPGLEAAAKWELEQKLNLLGIRLENIKKVRGGLSIECERAVGFALNHWLKIPTRILMRLDEFRCRDFPKLYNKVRKYPWSEFLRRGEVEYSVSTRASRLNLKDKIENVLKDALADSDKHQPFRKEFLKLPQIIFVRVLDDVVTVSLDTSGEALYKRSYKTLSVEAPLRENLASGLIQPLLKNFDGGPAIDMMAGSGTLGFELASFHFCNRSRQYAFQNFPKITAVDEFLKSEQQQKFSITLVERDPKAFKALSENAKVFTQKYKLDVDCKKQDIFELDPKGSHLLCNPPYNERLSADTAELWKKIKTYSATAESLSLIWPGEKPPDHNWKLSVRLLHGGIPVTLNFWSR